MTSPIPVLVGLGLCLALAPVQAQRVVPAALTRVAAHETLAPSRSVGGVALWQALCRPDSASRRAGM